MSAKLTKVKEDTPRMLRRRSASNNWWSHQSSILWGTSSWSPLVTGSTRLTAQGSMGATPRQKS